MHTINAHAKVNIFLKITGHKEGYHTLLSRFVRVDDLYDTITFVPQECDTFTIEGCEGVALDSNTIFKAYKALNAETGDPDILEFFYKHKVVVEKRIPSQAGLGGGSSDAAAFIRLTNEVCHLKLSMQRLSEIGSTIGADLPFFIYNFPSANVSGFGEVVEPFEEESPTIELYTPPVGCDTALVYKIFKEYYLPDVKPSSFIGWNTLPSRELLRKIDNPIRLNDLYRAALRAYPELENYAKKGWFFSGSGSTFFRTL
ncbi:MAG: 4-(cytidine 5'-diphospho)-2-C-methyl-D-erythritol kinase [Epsilonproteobacteria bacterium]|nr:MAG: 4-(cytidine 5'-diphospho)-2-C-methyl-D-erythritol kinase [Campylobacterota bacterium]